MDAAAYTSTTGRPIADPLQAIEKVPDEEMHSSFGPVDCVPDLEVQSSTTTVAQSGMYSAFQTSYFVRRYTMGI